MSRNPQNPKNFPNRQIFWNAPLLGACFILLLAGHFLLSFESLSVGLTLWVGIFLVALPFFLLLTAALEDKSPNALPLYRQELFRPPGRLLWVFLAILALAIRLVHLTDLVAWPRVDENVHAFIAWDLLRHWQWRIFSYCSQMPPFYFWLEAGLFRLLNPSLTALWLLPALLSLIPFLFAYRESQRYFSKSLSFLLAFLMGLGFWPLFLGRFSHPAALVFPWTCFTLTGLGRLLAAPLQKRALPALVLGLLCATGFYTYLSWAPVALFTAGVVFWKVRDWRTRAWFTASLLVCLFPIGLAMVQEGYGSYLVVHWPLSRPKGWLILGESPFRYLGALFWGDPHNSFYTSTWGGLLNLLWGPLFWIGLAALFRPGSRKTGFFTLVALLLFLLPGVLTYSVNCIRVTQCLPVMAFISALGLQALVAVLPSARRVIFIVLALAASTGLDAYHLFVAFPIPWSHPTSSAQAYAILEEQQRQQGPGLVFTAFQPNWTDESLGVLTYPFNVALNPKLDPSAARWAAWVCNINDRPFLEKRFPQGRILEFSGNSEGEKEDWMLQIVPVSAAERETWARWTTADRIFLDAVSVLMNRKEGSSYGETREALLKAQPLAQGDPFLETCLWEQVFNSYNNDAAYGNHQQFNNFLGALAVLNQELTSGYPTAYFYNERGSMEVLVGNKQKAVEDFKRAVACPLDRTSAVENLKTLQAEKN